jgi:hypothetical protein
VLIQQRWLPVALAALAMISPAFCPKLAGRLSPRIRRAALARPEARIIATPWFPNG